jgi:hypothetical protein
MCALAGSPPGDQGTLVVVVFLFSALLLACAFVIKNETQVPE